MKTAKEILKRHKPGCHMEYSEESILAAIQEALDEVEIKSRLDAIEIAKEIFEDYKIAHPETYSNDYNMLVAIQEGIDEGMGNKDDYDMQCPFCKSSDTKYYNMPSGKCNDCNRDWALSELKTATFPKKYYIALGNHKYDRRIQEILLFDMDKDHHNGNPKEIYDDDSSKYIFVRSQTFNDSDDPKSLSPMFDIIKFFKLANEEPALFAYRDLKEGMIVRATEGRAKITGIVLNQEIQVIWIDLDGDLNFTIPLHEITKIIDKATK